MWHWTYPICGSDGSRGPSPHLFLDQTEALRAEKNFCWDWPPPPPYLRVWLPVPPYLKVWIRHCVALHFRNRRGAGSLRWRNCAEITAVWFSYRRKSYPIWCARTKLALWIITWWSAQEPLLTCLQKLLLRSLTVELSQITHASSPWLGSQLVSPQPEWRQRVNDDSNPIQRTPSNHIIPLPDIQ